MGLDGDQSIFLHGLEAYYIGSKTTIYSTQLSPGNIEEVKEQRIADSEGPTRFILTFLICTFTVFVM